MNELACADPDVLRTESQVAEILNLSIRTLQTWRVRRAGPKYVQVGQPVRYRRRDLLARIDANTIGPSTGRSL